MNASRIVVAITILAVSGCVSVPRAGNTPGVVESRPSIPRTIVARGELLALSKNLIEDRNVYLGDAYRALIQSADGFLTAPSQSVTLKQAVPPGGDRHDYMSRAPYWWPDTTKMNGLPYIRRDGIVNPQSRLDHDGLRFLAMTDAVEALSLAWYFTGEVRYARRASSLLHVWFVDTATRMNPHLRFAQAIPGVVEGRGIGIIDLRHLPRVVDAVRILETSGEWKQGDAMALNAWARSYLTWLRDSEHGKQESLELNNHGTLYDAQVVALALFVGDTSMAKNVFETSVRGRMSKHLAADGSQPLELERTRPIHYSLFNLDGFTQLAEMGRHVGVDLWAYTTPAGASLRSAIMFLAPYSDTARKWSKRDVSPIAPDVSSIVYRRASAVIPDTSFMRAAHRGARTMRSSSRELLFYPGASVASVANADSLAAAALDFSLAKLRATAVAHEPSAGFPRITGSDGRWLLRPFNQWTSGFFAGTLWYAYRATSDDQFRVQAIRWTEGMERAKSLRTTHDLGFMIHDSFGHGYSLTGDTAYRSIVLAASASLATRFNPKVGAIKSWDTERQTDRRGSWKYPVIVDNLMNLEMLFQAAKWGNPDWRSMAERHALTTARSHLRADGSTPHVALFDPETGQLERTVTWQGYSDSSAWSRGQAWAIHGFATAHHYSRKPELLRAATRAADYFIAHLPPDGVPFWDLLHPDIPNTERDASAAAIAASGLLDLARQTTGENSARYHRTAERIIASLSADYTSRGTSSDAILLHSVGQRPQNVEVDVGIVYADYYFLEALLRRKGVYWR